MVLIRVYNQSTRYLYSSTFQSTCTCTQVLLKIQYLYLYLYSSIFQVLVLVLEYFCPVLAPSLLNTEFFRLLAALFYDLEASENRPEKQLRFLSRTGVYPPMYTMEHYSHHFYGIA